MMRAGAKVWLLVVLAGCASGTAAPQARPAASGRVAHAWEVPRLPAPAPVTAAEFASRRQALQQHMGDGVLIVFGAQEPAADYLPYAQSADFRYLTGITEPGALYVAVKRQGRVEERLYVQPRDASREVWEGARLGAEGARQRTGIASYPSDRAYAAIDSLVHVHRKVYSTTMPAIETSPGVALTHAQQVLARLCPNGYTPLQVQIQQLRAKKSAAELDRIRRAAYISAVAHREAMRELEPGMNEFEIRALLEYTYVRYGAEGPAYASIVGSGPNSTTLHYRAANRFMNDGEVLLIDAAASYGGYAADVTRTLPVNGRFTAAQRAIYEIVLAAQKAAESKLRIGATWQELNDAANGEIAAGLARLGLIDSADGTYDCPGRGGVTGRCAQYRLFYMHGLGHGVGLAVHDPDISSTPGGFRPGSAVTIEPGVYVRGDAFDYLLDTPANRALVARRRAAHARYRDIGVRIEDVYIMDERGVERASAGAPREIAEIETLMRDPGMGAATRRRELVEWYRVNQGR
jgi:Xaa-Pro aminopeptidase